MLVCTLAFVLLWRPMLWTFKADATMYGYGAHVFRQMALGFVFCGVANTLALCCGTEDPVGAAPSFLGV
jgi:hypothetical protein